MTTPPPTHEVTSQHWPGTYGDRPEPWQRTYECSCGADLGFDEEGGLYADVESAMAEHLADEGLNDEGDDCD